MTDAYRSRPGRARHLIALVAATEDTELDCDAVALASARWAEMRAAGESPELLVPGLTAHLRQCPDCARLLDDLTELVRLDRAGTLPSDAELWPRSDPPPRAASGHREASPALWGLAGRLAFDWSRPTLLAALTPTLAAAAVVLMLGGLWRQADRDRWSAVRSAEEARLQARSLSELLATSEEQLHDMMEAVSESESVAFSARPDGSWMRLFYSPDERVGVIVVGDLSTVDEGESLSCWLRSADGGELVAAAVDDVSPDMDWWVIRGDRPLGDYDNLEIAVDDEGRELFQLALAEQPVR